MGLKRAGVTAKRLIDLALSLGLLLVASPVLALVALSIRIRLGRPVLFKQQRPGYKGRPFCVYKFRTMTRASERNGKPLSDGDRMGRLGRLLRRTSLDELPQLINVLKGEMSLVGPRPLLMEYLDLYTPEQMRRHDVPPGITGLAQVSGRNNVPWDERFDLDVWYVDHWSLRLDLKILLLSVERVMRGEGVAARGVSTMTRFTGKID